MSKDQGRENGVAIVVGGSGGIGSAICRRLATEWDGVVVTYRSKKEEAEALCTELSSLGRVECVSMDVRDSASIREGLEHAAKLGPLRAVVFASGANILQPMVATITHEQWLESIEIELLGFIRLVSEALPLFRKQGGGVFASLASVGNYRFPPGDALSTVPKAGIEALSRAIAREEGKNGIRANCIGVGIIDAGLVKKFQEVLWDEGAWNTVRSKIPLKRLGEASEIADAIAYLISNRSSYVTGQTLIVDGGYCL